MNSSLADGSIWRLHQGEREIARLIVTGTDMPWVHARLEALVGFDEYRPVFAEQQRALDAEDWLRADACYERIRGALTMTFPDGRAVAEFMVHIHADGAASWRWHDEPFESGGPAHAALENPLVTDQQENGPTTQARAAREAGDSRPT